MSSIYNSVNNTVKNEGGVVLKGGNLSDVQNYLNLVSLIGNYESNDYPYSSSPVELNTLTKKAIVGVFAYNRSRPLTKGTTAVVNIDHVDHDLKTPGTADVSIDTNIHAMTKNRNRLDTTAIRNNKYNTVTGKFDEGYPVVSVDQFGNDNATLISRENPGRLSFSTGKVIVSQNYNSKTN
jgi:hypothetical protein